MYLYIELLVEGVIVQGTTVFLLLVVCIYLYMILQLFKKPYPMKSVEET